MNGEVRVVGRNRKIPSKAKNRRVARREQRAALARVRALSGGDGLGPLADTIQAGNDTADGATVFKFFPAAPVFHVGDKVTLQMSPASSEVHTFTFGPTDYNVAIANVLVGPAIDPRGGYPSDEPPGVVSYNGKNHGNGFFNSGFLDSDAATPLPTSTSIRFTAAGSYSLICLIHPFMRATVTVTT